MSASPHLSVVIPAYNEASRLAMTLERLLNYLRAQDYSSEVIVVDDGSSDSTRALAESFVAVARPIELRVIASEGNRGKGFSVLNGVRHARGEIILFTDADLSTPIEEAEKLLEPLRSCRYDITFGSRGLKDSDVRVRESIVRESGGKIFNLVVRLVTGLPYKDTQCGFKAFKRDATRWVFDRQTIYDFGFDVEILYLASKRGLRLLEIPVQWSHHADTRIRFFSDAVRMSVDLLRIRFRDWSGQYREVRG